MKFPVLQEPPTAGKPYITMPEQNLQGVKMLIKTVTTDNQSSK
jgi:hypothetical protein